MGFKNKIWPLSRSSRPTEHPIDFDGVLEYIGAFGKWQWSQLIMLNLVPIAAGMAVVTFAFTGFVPNYRCVIPECESLADATYYNQAIMADDPEASMVNKTYADFVLATVKDVATKPRGCKKLQPSGYPGSFSCQDLISTIQKNVSAAEEVTCSREELIFDNSIVLDSVVTDFDLTCDDHFVRSVFNSLYLGGMLLGSFVIGLISDHFGRIKAMAISIILVGGAGVLCAFVSDRTLFGLLRILTGMGGMGCYMVPYVIAAESSLPSFTVRSTLTTGSGFVIGELIFALEAYFIRDWVTLDLVVYAPMLALLVLCFVVPESTRWLIANGQNEKARVQIRKGAKMNGIDEVPDYLLVGKPRPSRMNLNQMDAAAAADQPVKHPTLLDLFKPMPILKRSLNMFYQWISVTMCYYGLLFASTSLSGDPHLNFALVIFAELPSLFAYMVLPDLWGRRPNLVTMQLTSGISCIIAGILTEHPDLAKFQVFCAMLGRCCAAMGFGMVYLYTSELFPTKLRSTAVGTCSTMARVGGVVSLLMLNLAAIWRPFPMVIMGVVATIAGLLAFLFPETVDDPLPETMEEALHIGSDSRRNICGCYPGCFKS